MSCSQGTGEEADEQGRDRGLGKPEAEARRADERVVGAYAGEEELRLVDGVFRALGAACLVTGMAMGHSWFLCTGVRQPTDHSKFSLCCKIVSRTCGTPSHIPKPSSVCVHLSPTLCSGSNLNIFHTG